MRILLILSLLLLVGAAYAQDAAPLPSQGIVLPPIDFPDLKIKSARLSGVLAIADGRQVVVLQNGMAFVSMTDERLPVDAPAGTVLGITPVFPLSTDPDRHPYLFSIGTGRGRPQMGGYRIR